MKQCNQCLEQMFDKVMVCGVCGSKDLKQITQLTKPKVEEPDEPNESMPLREDLKTKLCKKCGQENGSVGNYCATCHADFRSKNTVRRKTIHDKNRQNRERLIKRDKDRELIERNRQGKIKRGRG